MKIGDMVQKIFPYDGTNRAGKIIAKKLIITEIKDHCPIDGQKEKNAIIYLSDGTWEHPWNLTTCKI